MEYLYNTIWIIENFDNTPNPPLKFLRDFLKKKNIEFYYYEDFYDLKKNDQLNFVFYAPPFNFFKKLIKKNFNLNESSIILGNHESYRLFDIIKFKYIFFNHFSGYKAYFDQIIFLNQNINFNSIFKDDYNNFLIKSYSYLNFFLSPLIDLQKRKKVKKIFKNSKPLAIYFPLFYSSDYDNFKKEQKIYDVSNVGSTNYKTYVRYELLSSKFNLTNIYYDRLLFSNYFKNVPDLKFFDVRDNYVYGSDTLDIYRKSKFVISSNGSLDFGVYKFLEIPMNNSMILGSLPKNEFHFLKDITYEIGVNDLFSKNKIKNDLIKFHNSNYSNLDRVKNIILNEFNLESIFNYLNKQISGGYIEKKPL